jgi:fumarate hydratase subunit alpha
MTRSNPGGNSGVGVPNFRFDYVPEQEFLDIILSFKGCGAELGNAMKIFTTAQLGKDYCGLKRNQALSRRQKKRNPLGGSDR